MRFSIGVRHKATATEHCNRGRSSTASRSRSRERPRVLLMSEALDNTDNTETTDISAIELREITLSFGRDLIFKQINLSIARGERFVVIGPSGEGKSCLLKVMAGLIPPTSGQLIVEGLNWLTMSRREHTRVARKTGMLFQKNALFDSLNVAENVAFPIREVGNSGASGQAISEDEIQRRVKFYLEAVEIDHAKALYPDEISGGMQKRLGIARALALEPETVFYDDPTAGLDPITSRKIIQLIVDLQRKMKTTVIAVTNDMNRVDQLADRVGMVVDHELIPCGSPIEMKAHPDPRVQQFIRGDLFGPLTGPLAGPFAAAP